MATPKRESFFLSSTKKTCFTNEKEDDGRPQPCDRLVAAGDRVGGAVEPRLGQEREEVAAEAHDDFS